jgi:hypothetical protein
MADGEGKLATAPSYALLKSEGAKKAGKHCFPAFVRL